MHVFTEHKSPVSAMSMDYGEKGFFSASWDGEAIASFLTFDIPLIIMSDDLALAHLAMGSEYGNCRPQLHGPQLPIDFNSGSTSIQRTVLRPHTRTSSIPTKGQRAFKESYRAPPTQPELE